MDMLHKKRGVLDSMSFDDPHGPGPYGGELERDEDAGHDEGADGMGPVPVKPGRELIEVSRQGARCYRLEKVKCGKKSCRCAEGDLHGPYWYAYFREDGRMRCEYMGKSLPEHVILEDRARKARKSSEAERARAAIIVAEVKETLKRARGASRLS